MAYQIGFYMDSIRRRAEISLKDALQEVRKAGYEGVELAGLFGNSPEQVREWARAAELTIISAQVGIEDFLAEPGKTVLDYQELGCAYITLPGLTEKWRKATNYRWLVKQLDLLGEYCNQFNLQLLYRNQAEELRMKRENGESILANLLVDVPDYFMKLEADTAWLTIAGEDAAAYLTTPVAALWCILKTLWKRRESTVFARWDRERKRWTRPLQRLFLPVFRGSLPDRMEKTIYLRRQCGTVPSICNAAESHYQRNRIKALLI